jgi:arylsulfatase A-like enzyme
MALPLNVTTLPEALEAVGYRRAMIGKWHLGYASWENTPLGRGFESFVGYYNGQGHYYQHTSGGPLGNGGFDFWQNKSAAWDQVGRYSMDFYMDEARRVLETHDPNGPPLFLYFAHQVSERGWVCRRQALEM